ncbi:HEAT repeat domain-containing protein [Aquipuribacter sp. MA13-6]|uniref:HEAT repeat domain-containing protein n=1 Tax=unclassified Aquipuribacter TaxID=2635084 RepID=UPI003EEF91A6
MLIGEVARRSGISARMLRHYDSMGLVPPSGRSAGGYREYEEEDLRRLFHVEALRSLGLGLPEVAAVLDDLSFDPATVVDGLLARTQERLAQEQELLRRLAQVRASRPAAWSDVLRLVGLVRGLDAASPSARQRFALSLRDPGDATTLAAATLDETDPVVAGALGWALARTGDSGVPVLAEALHSPVAGRRHRAVAALGKIGSPEAAAVLADAVAHPDPLVAGRAALARGARGDLDAVPALVALVAGGRDDVDAAGVLGALAARHGCADDIARAITTRLAGTGDEGRRRLVAALAEVPGPAARRTLTGLLEDPDRGVALTASSLLRARPAEA